MRIESIDLAWFRGAASHVSLEACSKSLVVYGENGSGKSSFVDAIEYVLKGGRIEHLAHEYSGRHQEKGTVNTHTPDGHKTKFSIKFKNGQALKTEIERDGSSVSSGAEDVAINTWDYRRTVLRQDEVSAFIHETKGGKYSALLPLLGLDRMEATAQNLRQLAKSVEDESNLRETGATLNRAEIKRMEVFGADTYDQILRRIEDLHKSTARTRQARPMVWLVVSSLVQRSLRASPAFQQSRIGT